MLIAALMEETVVELLSLQICALNAYVSMIAKQTNGLSIKYLVNMFELPLLESIPTPLEGASWSWVRCGPKVPITDQIYFCQVLCMVGIKLQLLYSVRIELATGSFPYPRQS